MKVFKFSLYTVVCMLLLLSESLQAQINLSFDELTAVVRAPYSALDSTKVSTGYLVDKTVDLVKLPLFDGESLCDSNYVDIALFRDLFRTMNHAKSNDSACLYDADSIYSVLTSSPNVKLCAALFQYNRIRADAITNDLIIYDENTGVFHDYGSGEEWRNPYETDYVFMFSASRHISETTQVVFDLSDLTTYCTCSINSVLIDYGNGEGYSPLDAASLCPVSYSSCGTKEIKLKISLHNNLILESHTRIFIQSSSPAYSQGNSTSLFQPDSVFTVSYGDISALCSVKYAAGHGHVAQKPFIYVEGFDHPVLGELQRIVDSSLFVTINNARTAIDNILTDNCHGNYYYSESDSLIVKYGYDLFYVDWNNPEASILQNAELLKQVINEVNALKPSNGGGDRTVIVGHSMGGLISRVALLQMEESGLPHQVGCFVSQDVPHLGANVPIGVQYTIRDLYRFLFGPNGNSGIGLIPNVKSIFDKVVGILDSDSARQMMYYHVNSSGEIEHSFHDQWQYYLDLKGFPKGDVGYPIENLTIVSGNALDSGVLSNKVLSFGLFLVDLKTLFGGPFPTTFMIDVDIDRDRQNNWLVSKTMLLYTCFSKVLQTTIAVPILCKEHRSPSNAIHYDTVPGSFLSFSNPTSFWLNNPFLNLDTGEKIVFVPSGSSFAVENYTDNFYTNISAFESASPFDSYCMEASARRHDSGLNKYLTWIDEQTKIRLSCNPFVLSGDRVIAYDTPFHVMNESISSSSPTAVSVGSNGTITVNYPDLVTFTYRAEKTISDSLGFQRTRFYRKRCRSLAGFPDMNLNAVHQSGNDYSVTATCVSSDSELRSYVDTLAARGVLKYIWGIKNSDNTYTWSDTTSTRSFAYTVQPNSLVHVCMKLCDSLGRVSTTINDVEIDRRSTVKYLYEPDIMTVTSLGSIYHYQYLSGTTMLNNHYFCTWKNPDYSPAPAAPDNITVKGDYIPLKTSYYTNVAGVNTTVYCFEFLQSSELQDAIDEVLSDSSIRCAFIPIQIRNGTTVLQDVMFYVEKPTRVPDLPQPPH